MLPTVSTSLLFTCTIWLERANQHRDMQIRQCYKCLCDMFILLPVMLIFVLDFLMLVILNTDFAEHDAHLCI